MGILAEFDTLPLQGLGDGQLKGGGGGGGGSTSVVWLVCGLA